MLLVGGFSGRLVFEVDLSDLFLKSLFENGSFNVDRWGMDFEMDPTNIRTIFGVDI